MNLREQIGRRVKQARERQGWSQRQLGERANVAASFLSRLERGQTGIEIDTLAALAAALEVDVGVFLTQPDPEPSSPPSGLDMRSVMYAAADSETTWRAIALALAEADRLRAEAEKQRVTEVEAVHAQNLRAAIELAQTRDVSRGVRHDGGAVAADGSR